MSKTPEERKAYQAAWAAKKREKLSTKPSESVDTNRQSVDKTEGVDKVEMSTNVHKATTFEKVPTVFPGVFTLKPVEVNVIDSNWHPSEVARHDIKQSIFTSCGVPTKAPDGKEYVLVAGSLDVNLDGEIEPFTAVTVADWRAGLERTCMHGLHGWSCKEC